MSFIEKELVPSWVDLYKDMRLSGITHDRIISMLQDSISDSYGKEWSMNFISQLNKVFDTE